MQKMKQCLIAGATVVMLSGCESAPPALQVETKVIDKASNQSPRIEHMIFFPFNSDELPSNTNQILTPHVEYLISHPDEILLVQGYADEVGSNQFNYDLGTMRANAVVKALLALGVSERQLKTQSAGEKRPLNHGSWPETHSRNRRVALYY